MVYLKRKFCLCLIFVAVLISAIPAYAVETAEPKRFSVDLFELGSSLYSSNSQNKKEFTSWSVLDVGIRVSKKLEMKYYPYCRYEITAYYTGDRDSGRLETAGDYYVDSEYTNLFILNYCFDLGKFMSLHCGPGLCHQKGTYVVLTQPSAPLIFIENSETLVSSTVPLVNLDLYFFTNNFINFKLNTKYFMGKDVVSQKMDMLCYNLGLSVSF
jgi:hypothetical protein